MWFLEHVNAEGERTCIWLRPGKQYLFGRPSSSSKPNDNDITRRWFPDKSISRQHMMLKVEEVDVEHNQGTLLHERPGVEVRDLSCRQAGGVTVDGQKRLVGEKDGDAGGRDREVLKGDEHTLRLSDKPEVPELRLKWHAVVITTACKIKPDVIKQIHALGIKTSDSFVHGYTTHVVTTKRNLPKVLQGLLAGCHIVTSEFIQDLLHAATPQNPDPEDYRPSKLEQDYVAYWPREKEYIPPPASEPVKRPGNLLEPDEGRSDLFSGLSFIFLDETQFNQLKDVITSGNGKAHLFPFKAGVTVDAYVKFASTKADKKAWSAESSGPLPVVTIRPAVTAENQEWATDIVVGPSGIDQTLNQRSIFQNELLDAIVMKNVSQLRQPAPPLDMGSSAPVPDSSPPSAPTRDSGSEAVSRGQDPTPGPAEEEEQEPAKLIPRKRPARRAITQSRFTGFDDYEPPAKSRKIEKAVEDTPMEDIQPSAPSQKPSSTRATHSQPTTTSTRTQTQSTTATTRRQRGPAVVQTIEKLDEDELFPATAAIKKRRAATRAATEGADASAPAPVDVPKTKGARVLEQLQKTKRKIDRDFDVREHTKKRLEEEDARRKQEEESLREALDGIDISEMRARVQVEEMEVKPRPRRGRQETGQGSGGGGTAGQDWKDEWNGRKNFKKFRRRGAEAVPPRPRVIVQLEEVSQKKGFGLGEPFFLEEAERSTGTPRSPVRQPRSQAGSQSRGGPVVGSAGVGGSESEPEQGFSRTRARRSQQTGKEVVDVDDSEGEGDVDVDIDVEDEHKEPVASGRSRTQRVAETQMDERASQQRKRPSAAAASGQPPSKRGRTATATARARSAARVEEDSDAEETGFRFRRRR